MPIFWRIIVSKIEDITGKPNTQLNVMILNPNGEVIERKMFDNMTQPEIASLVCWTSLFYCLINQSEFADASVRRSEQKNTAAKRTAHEHKI